MPDAQARLGALGEEIAAAHLQRAGTSLLARNYRTRLGEVDVVSVTLPPTGRATVRHIDGVDLV